MKWGLAAAVASAAAVAAASSAEILACDCDVSAPQVAAAAAVGRCDEFLSRQRHDDEEGSASREKSRRGSGGDRFAPRFDGLRFIETLVTAHR
ncbi:hypothetical protein EJB05_22857 [Eragrostis curvula]|uniref:Secreted protein n=1 Tax=Eragrostis curvula TaxID=38414 RepID=A0A5J9V709_9POAL|nr:hypothetical protein EJB05_22857 [Eragrostis curvula]